MTRILVDDDIATIRDILSFVAQSDQTKLHKLGNIRIREELLFWKALRAYEIEFVRPPETFFSSWHLQYLVEHRMLVLEGPMWAADGESPVFLYILKMFQGISGEDYVWLIKGHRIP